MDKTKPTVPAAKSAAKPRRSAKPAAAKTLPGLPSDPPSDAKPAVAAPVAKTAPANTGLPLTSPAKTAEKSVAAVVAAPVPAPEAPVEPVAETPALAAKPVEAAKSAVPIVQPVAESAKPILSSPTAAVSADSKPKDTIMEATSTIENAAKDTAAKTQAMFGEAQARTQAGMEKSAKLFEDMIAFNKENLEAVVESSKIAAKGAETLGQGAADYAKRSFEQVSQVMQTLSQVKSPTEFMKLQSDFARSSFDSMVAETSRSTEHMMKLAGEIAQPLSNRLAVAAEKMKTVA
ncbi:phasin family protein [Sphingomonas parapaucimobilis]|uniref:Phasin family protein n=1 Tax=Sphingomonas parapaucimobilis NBRC 15100 TaxID=1219049 RepID=A0A0A1W822_9SPHN|nr:phasin family protein [Sphingomonas parapaucimobilis]GAM01468.1 phasin family protein [Sphingomonas parapaucimobilis NBRC 15100]